MFEQHGLATAVLDPAGSLSAAVAEVRTALEAMRAADLVTLRLRR